MPTMYERLEKDTAAARAQFMDIPIVKDLLSGAPMPEAPDPQVQQFMRGIYAAYLRDSYYYVREAASVYALAGSRMDDSKSGIRRWLLEHAVEEYGHHHWIVEDLDALGYDTKSLPTSKPSVWCDALIAYTFYIAGHANPIGLLGDTYVIEGLSQMFATQLAGTMKGMLALPDNAIKYLAAHGEADQGHMDEFRDTFNAGVRTEQDYQDILQVAKAEFALYGGMAANLMPS